MKVIKIESDIVLINMCSHNHGLPQDCDALDLLQSWAKQIVVKHCYDMEIFLENFWKKLPLLTIWIHKGTP